MEQSLWKAVPAYLRRVSNALKKVKLNQGAEIRIKLESFAASARGEWAISVQRLVLLFGEQSSWVVVSSCRQVRCQHGSKVRSLCLPA